MAAESMAMPQRITLLDTTKGLAIILIVLGHVLRGLHSASLLPTTFPFHTIDTLLYTIHVPVFFFISGYLLNLSTTQTWPQFLKNKLLWIALPYLLWSALQGSFGVIMSGSTNHAVTWQHVIATPWHPLGQFWFLHALLVLQVLFFALRQTPLSFMWLLAIVGLLIGHSMGWRLDGSNLSWPFYAIFLLAGYHTKILTKTHLTIPTHPLLPAATIALFLILETTLLTLGIPYGNPWLLLGNITAIAAMFGLAKLLETPKLLTPLALFLQWAGRGSMAILVMHILATAGTRIILEKAAPLLHITPTPTLHIIAGTLVGTLAPLITLAILQKLKLAPYLGFR